MIVVISKIQVRREPQSFLPGAPTSTNPLVFSPGLDIGELSFTTDTGRILIGADPTQGQPNYQRTVFPYQNIEVLTENSPRVQELVAEIIRQQDRTAFFVPTTIAAGYSGYLTYSEYDGGLAIPARINGDVVSAIFEYHAFYNNSGVYSPVKAGTLRLLLSGAAQFITDDECIAVDNPSSTSLTFNVSGELNDSNGNYYMLGAHNLTSTPMTIFLRSVTVQATGGIVPYQPI